MLDERRQYLPCSVHGLHLRLLRPLCSHQEQTAHKVSEILTMLQTLYAQQERKVIFRNNYSSKIYALTNALMQQEINGN